MTMLALDGFQIAALLLLAGAAFWDARTGLIPNALTLPPLLLAPLVHGWAGGVEAAGWSVLSALACALLPYLMFRKGAAGGGDVKVLAALGATAGMSLGLETQILGSALAAAFALLRLAYQGQLLATLYRSLLLLLSGFLPRSRRPKLELAEMSVVRMGVFFFMGAWASLYLQGMGA